MTTHTIVLSTVHLSIEQKDADNPHLPFALDNMTTWSIVVRDEDGNLLNKIGGYYSLKSLMADAEVLSACLCWGIEAYLDLRDQAKLLQLSIFRS